MPKQLKPLDELVLTILSQNTSDTNRDRAWASLRARFPAWDEVADARTADVVESIRVGGLAETKAPRIQHVLRSIRERHGSIDLGFLRRRSDGDVREFLGSLPGVGPKTVACVMAFSLRRPILPVDTHVHRIAIRLGLVPPKMGAGPAHEALEVLVHPDDRLPLHVALITHGRRVCTALRPRCEGCVLSDFCPRVGVV
jgi:endonuclease-3